MCEKDKFALLQPNISIKTHRTDHSTINNNKDPLMYMIFHNFITC